MDGLETEHGPDTDTERSAALDELDDLDAEHQRLRTRPSNGQILKGVRARTSRGLHRIVPASDALPLRSAQTQDMNQVTASTSRTKNTSSDLLYPLVPLLIGSLILRFLGNDLVLSWTGVMIAVLGVITATVAAADIVRTGGNRRYLAVLVAASLATLLGVAVHLL